jgi:hypothetical protein
MTTTGQAPESGGPTAEPIDLDRTATLLAALLPLLRRLAARRAQVHEITGKVIRCIQ